MKTEMGLHYQLKIACVLMDALLSSNPEVDLTEPANCLRIIVPDPQDRELLALRLSFLASFVCVADSSSMLAVLKPNPADSSLWMRADDAAHTKCEIESGHRSPPDES